MTISKMALTPRGAGYSDGLFLQRAVRDAAPSDILGDGDVAGGRVEQDGATQRLAAVSQNAGREAYLHQDENQSRLEFVRQAAPRTGGTARLRCPF
jgi:hypothetical protein